MKVSEISKPNPLLAQAKDLTKRSDQLKQQARQTAATKSVAKAKENLTKATQRQARANSPKPSLPTKAA
jgi:hypothetical protein